jgi:hypothetical protein
MMLNLKLTIDEDSLLNEVQTENQSRKGNEQCYRKPE